MFKYNDIYLKRISYDCSSQPLFENDYKEIGDDLRRNSSLEHPYGVPPIDFTKNSCYQIGNSKWNNAIVDKSQEYLYHIDNLPKLMAYRQYNLSVVNKDFIRKELSINNFVDNLVDPVKITNLYEALMLYNSDWIALSNLLLHYRPVRNITWWTNADMENINSGESLLETAHKVGLATNWINNYSIVMRYDLKKAKVNSYVSEIKVPSIVDAFHSPIFLAQKQADIPKHGVAIDLHNMTATGHNEYVIRGVSLDALEFRTIKISDECLSKFSYAQETTSFYDKIINLY